MNIFRQELKAGRKSFLFWMIGMFVLIFIGMFKYTGFQGDIDIMEIFDAFPKVVLAVFGMVGVDITTIGGYYSLLAYYSMLCAAIYAIHLGTNTVTRENVDKTYEFIFTKPRTRNYILQMKMLAGLLSLLKFSLGTYLFSLMAVSVVGEGETISYEVFLFTMAQVLIALMFFMIAALITSYTKNAEKGVRYSNLCFLLSFAFSMIYDMLENGGVLKMIAPFKYFISFDILEGQLNIMYVLLCLVISALCYFFALRCFAKKDFLA